MSHDKAFRLLDKDRGGSISADELKAVFGTDGGKATATPGAAVGMTLADIQSLIDMVDIAARETRARGVYLNKAEDVCAGCLLGCGPVDGTRAKSQSAPPGAVAGAGPAEIAPSPHATEDGSESERLKRVAGAPHAPDQHALTREQSKSVQLFVQSMVKLRDENPATKRRETSRFQAYRKKYSRPINQKPAPAAVCSQLQTEAFTDDEDDCHSIADGRGR
jgi:hypothetical protein